MPPPWRVCCLTSGLSSGLDRKLCSNPGALGGLTTGTQHRKASSGLVGGSALRTLVLVPEQDGAACSALRLTSEGFLVGRPRDRDLPNTPPPPHQTSRRPLHGAAAHLDLPSPEQPPAPLGALVAASAVTSPGGMCIVTSGHDTAA